MEAKIIHKISYENLTLIIESMVAKQFKNSDQPVTVDELTDYLWETPEKEYVLFEIGSQRKPETMSDQTIEQRISVLEKEIAVLKVQISEPSRVDVHVLAAELLALYRSSPTLLRL